MIRPTHLAALVPILLFLVAPTAAQACKVATAGVTFASGSADIAPDGDAELVHWVGPGVSGDGRGALLNVHGNPNEPNATELQRARIETVTRRLQSLGLRREDIRVMPWPEPVSEPYISVYPDPIPCPAD